VGAELASELLLQARDLLVEAAERGHQGVNHLPVGGRHRLGCGQLRCRQRVMDCHHPRLQVAAPAGADQRAAHHHPGQLAATPGRGRKPQHRQGLRLGQLGAERGQRPRVELPQRAAQRVDVPLPGPDQV
jgi:hypothetical protein